VSVPLGQPWRGRASEGTQQPAGPGDDARADSAASAAVLGLRDRLAHWRDLLDRPLTSYYLVLGCTLLLLALGLVTVLSASTKWQMVYGLPTYAVFQKQVLGAAGGLLIMWLASKAPVRLFRICAYPVLAASVLGLLLVLLVGTTQDGAERWIAVAGIQLQPSEFAKLAFAIWGADLLARKEKLRQLTDSRHLLIPLLPGLALLGLLVMAGDDLGTTFLLVVIFLALMWTVGTPARLLVGVVGLMLFVLLVLIVVQPWRIARIDGFFGQSSKDCVNACYQLTEAKYAMGSGGLFGVGLGASKSAYGWVPNGPNDFIFAILGEELGLLGTLCVIVLYGGIAFAGLRVARRVTDTFSRLAAGAITIWLVAQALVNIGAVLGVLPITGVPLPLISAGLSSLLVTMTALGMLMAFARSEPGAREALLAAGPSTPQRVLRWLGLGRRGSGEISGERGRWD
jgi:cell division protein FtsW